ncbi:MAG TPA: hypothetical protein VH092_28725, partial [Urbifossiella sp.]|nr:hypothetical protein [Urbifossiella sp.]
AQLAERGGSFKDSDPYFHSGWPLTYAERDRARGLVEFYPLAFASDLAVLVLLVPVARVCARSREVTESEVHH